MESAPAAKRSEKKTPPVGRDSSGIALFMVIAAVSLLAILVTEFTYISQISQRIAYDGLDQVKAHYLAKSGLKLSLLRLKAYQQVKQLTSSMGGGGKGSGQSVIPQNMLDKIWNFPFIFPIPANLPGLLPTQKEEIEKFQKGSSLDGSFSSVIQSESSRYNINAILKQYAATPSSSPSPTSPGTPNNPANPPSGSSGTASPTPTPSPAPSFKPEDARNGLSQFLQGELIGRSQADPDFANQYRDLKWDDFMDNLWAWIDRSYQRRQQPTNEPIPIKGAPMYSVSELHMIPLMDDQLYKLFEPTLTASMTNGININTMHEDMLRALVPGITDDEVKEFIKYRDDEEQDNSFKDTDSFFKWLQENVSILRNADGVSKFKTSLQQRNIQLTLTESQFKVTVQAHVNQATQLIEAWVTLGSGSTHSGNSGPNSQTPNIPIKPAPQQTQGEAPAPYTPPDAGLRITFMRFL